MRPHLPAVSVGLLTIALTAAGCSTGGDPELVRPTVVVHSVAPARPLPRLPVGPSSWQPGRRVWVGQGEIHLGSQVVDVAPLNADQAVATRGGTYFLNGHTLWLAGSDSARSTALTRVGRIAASPDGRYLGLVDRTYGPHTAKSGPVAAAVVYDTRTGRPVVRSYAGMGRPGPGLTRRYRASPPEALGFRGDTFLARTPAGVFGYSARSGRAAPARPAAS